MRGFLIAVFAAAASFAGAHFVLAQNSANEAVVVQREIAFDVQQVRIRVGGQVTFVNEDPFGHNVYSETPGGEFDVGRQGPRARNSVTFRRPGTINVLCRIHPRMTMQIIVE